MTTANALIIRALRRIRVVALGQDPAAEEQSLALDRLNDLIVSWKGKSVDLGLGTLSGGDTIVFFVPPKSLSGQVLDARVSQGDWNANTNTPALATGTGTAGFYYRVSTAGSTVLDDVTSWAENDYAVFDGQVWLKGQDHNKHIRGIEALLALEMCDDFAQQPMASLAGAARSGWQSLQSDFIRPPEDTFDRAIVFTTSRAGIGLLGS